MELVSVIVPVYNVERYLNRCVNSILNQSYKNIEIILVDDGSLDNCPMICDDFSEAYDNIKVIHKSNGGLSSARNAGIEASSGSYISFIDSDDFVDPDFIHRLYSLIKKNAADLAMLTYQEVTLKTEIRSASKEKEIVYKNEEVEEAFLQLKIDSVCVGLYSKGAIGNTRFKEGKTSEDIPFNFDVFRRIKTFVYAPEKRYFYFYNKESISNGPLDKNMLNYLRFRGDIYEFYKDRDSKLGNLSESLFARAAFGLQTRMALYGISDQIDEKDCKILFTSIFMKHKKSFFMAKNIPFSRKLVAIATFYFYGIMRTLGKVLK